MYSTADFRKGLKIELKGEPFVIIDFQHVKPGKGGAFVRTRLKSLVTDNILEQTFRSGEKVARPDIQEKEMQFLYKEGKKYYFMDIETYEQSFLTEKQLGENKDFLKPDIVISFLFHNEKPIGVDLPIFVDLAITHTDPGLKGDTASGGTKPATLETGAIIQVPLFLNEKDVVKIDTRTREYVERVS
jgi:elongation factor P